MSDIVDYGYITESVKCSNAAAMRAVRFLAANPLDTEGDDDDVLE